MRESGSKRGIKWRKTEKVTFYITFWSTLVKLTKFCVHIVFTRNFQIETYKYYFILRIAILFRFQRYQTHYHSFLFLPLFWPENIAHIFTRFFIFGPNGFFKHLQTMENLYHYFSCPLIGQWGEHIFFYRRYRKLYNLNLVEITMWLVSRNKWCSDFDQ